MIPKFIFSSEIKFQILSSNWLFDVSTSLSQGHLNLFKTQLLEPTQTWCLPAPVGTEVTGQDGLLTAQGAIAGWKQVKYDPD